jgi:hypothetical protein
MPSISTRYSTQLLDIPRQEQQEVIMSWINSGTDRSSVLAAAPELARKFNTFYASFWDQSHISVQTLELCRLRLAQLHNCTAEWQREDCKLPPRKRDNIARWDKEDSFTAPERACLELAEVYAMDPSAITDEHADVVKQYYGDTGLIVLLEALGVFDGMARMSLLWQLPSDSE